MKLSIFIFVISLSYGCQNDEKYDVLEKYIIQQNERWEEIYRTNIVQEKTINTLEKRLREQDKRIVYLEEELRKEKQEKGLAQSKLPGGERLLRTVERSDDAGSLQVLVDRMGQDVVELKAQVQMLQTQNSALTAGQGSVYVRWGSSTCPNTTGTVYSGVIGGSHYTESGANTNALCLPLNPVYDGHTTTRWITDIYGAEYDTSPETEHNMDSSCAVCHSPRSTPMMVPATNVCPSGWTFEYSGYLMGGYPSHAAGSEFVCMDSKLEGRIGSQAVNYGKLFYFTVGKCGSLPCPPYEEGKVITCVVCTK